MAKNDDVLAVLGSRRDPILLRLNEFNGRRTLDLRRYFYLNNSGDPKPTQRGVSLDKEMFAILQSALGENAGKIEEWLGGGSVAPLIVQSSAVEGLRTQPQSKTTREESWKGPEFFRFEGHGAVDCIIMNSGHPFSAALRSVCDTLQTGCPNKLRDLVVSVLLAYARAKVSFDGIVEMDPKSLFEKLEHNWGIILRRYVEDGTSDE